MGSRQKYTPPNFFWILWVSNFKIAKKTSSRKIFIGFIVALLLKISKIEFEKFASLWPQYLQFCVMFHTVIYYMYFDPLWSLSWSVSLFFFLQLFRPGIVYLLPFCSSMAKTKLRNPQSQKRHPTSICLSFLKVDVHLTWLHGRTRHIYITKYVPRTLLRFKMAA